MKNLFLLCALFCASSLTGLSAQPTAKSASELFCLIYRERKAGVPFDFECTSYTTHRLHGRSTSFSVFDNTGSVILINHKSIPCTIPLGLLSETTPNIQYHASNLDWRFISYMILYMFQCHSPKSSHPLPLPQSPKDCSIHLCLFGYLAYRVIVTIFLNSIYMH